MPATLSGLLGFISKCEVISPDTKDFLLPEDSNRGTVEEHGLWNNIGLGTNPKLCHLLLAPDKLLHLCLSQQGQYSIILVTELLRDKEMMPKKITSKLSSILWVLRNQ